MDWLEIYIWQKKICAKIFLRHKIFFCPKIFPVPKSLCDPFFFQTKKFSFIPYNVFWPKMHFNEKQSELESLNLKRGKVLL